MQDLNYKIYLLENNGNYAQLDTDGLNFTTTFAVSMISDISSRKDRISTNIVLKGTKNNNRIFGSLFNFSRYSDSTLDEKLFANYSPNRAVDCLVFESSTLLYKGSLKVIEIDKDNLGNITYEAVITGYFISFFGKVGDLLLTDISGFTESHTYDLPTITSSWDYDSNQSFCYGQIDFGKGVVPNASVFDLRNFRTGIYLKAYFDNLFSTFGYTYSGSFIDSDLFKKAYIPYTEQEFNKYVYMSLYDVSGDTSTVSMTTDAGGTYVTHGVNFSAATSNSYVTKTTNTFNGNPTDCFAFTRNVTTDGSISVDFSAHLTHANPVGAFSIGLYSIVNNTFSDAAIDKKLYSFNSSNLDIADTYTYRMPFTSYSAGTAFAIIGLLSDAPGESTTCTFTVNSSELKFGNESEQSQVEIKPNDTIYLADVIPQDVKIVDFFKSVLQMFNLYLIENPDVPNGIIIEPYSIFYDQCDNPVLYALDWTKKIDYTNGYKITINTTLPTEFDFTFTDDDDFYNDLYKQKYNDAYGNFTITNSKGSADPLAITTTFSPTVIVQENGDDKIMPAIFTGELTAKETMKSNMRMLYNNGTGTCKNYDIVLTSGNTVYTPVYTGLTTYNTSHHILQSGGTNVFNLQYGIPKEVYAPVTQDIFTIPYIYSTFYESQLEELNDDNIFILQCDVWLNEIDVANINFRTPVFIQNADGGAYFKINEIDYYNNQELSTVYLQKIVV